VDDAGDARDDTGESASLRAQRPVDGTRPVVPFRSHLRPRFLECPDTMDVLVRPPDTDAAGQSVPDLVARLRVRTHALHGTAERSGILRELLHGRATRAGYTLLLRNLHAPYEAMESALRQHASAPGVRCIAGLDLRRCAALESDLRALAGEAWAQRLPLLPAAEAYAAHVSTAQARIPGGLVAHAYVRHLGDLSGGQVLKRLLGKSPGIGAEALAFYDFEGVGDASTLVPRYLSAIDAAGRELGGATHDVVEEAALAFQCNIELSEEVLALVSATA